MYAKDAQLSFDQVAAPPPSDPPAPELTPEGRAACARIAELFADFVVAAETCRAADAREREARRRAELKAQLAGLDD